MRGHIRKRGSTYSIVVDLEPDDDGKRKQKWYSGYKTKKEAEKAINELLHKIEKGEFYVSEKISFKEYILKWLKEYGENNLAPKTYSTYSQLVDCYIISNLGGIELGKLKPLHLQSFYNYLQNDLELSGTTALHCHNIIHSSLKQAVKWQLINSNVADSVDRPKKNKNQMQVLDSNEVIKLLDAFKNSSMHIIVLIAVTTGMRRSEIAGLRWEDVDLDNGNIYIQNQLQMVNDILTLVPVKTEKSRRNIAIPDFIIPILKEVKNRQIENKNYLHDAYDDENYVCCQQNGNPYNPDYISRNFLRKMNVFSKELNIPKIRFHDLRHTHATLLLKQGVNPKIVQERLGHSSINVTLDTYSHVLPEMQKDAAKKINDIFIND